MNTFAIALLTAPAAPAVAPLVAAAAPLVAKGAGAAAAGKGAGLFAGLIPSLFGGDKKGQPAAADQAKSAADAMNASEPKSAPKPEDQVALLKAMSDVLGDLPPKHGGGGPSEVKIGLGDSSEVVKALLAEPPAPPAPPSAPPATQPKTKASDVLHQGRDRPPVLFPTKDKQ